MDENLPIDSRGEKKKKINFAKKKENTIRSLCEVEKFLCGLNRALKCGKIISFFNKH